MTDLWFLVSMAVTFALVDSVDPCFFAVYASILVSLSGSVRDLRKVFYASSSFIASVSVGYFAIGLLVRSLARGLPIGREATAYLLVAYGALLIAIVALSKGKPSTDSACREGRSIACFVAEAISRGGLTSLSAKLPYLYASVVGLLASFTILPCSAGLYVVYNVATASLGLYAWVPLTALYVAVFVSPLLLLSLAMIGLLKLGRRTYLRHFGLARLLGGLLSIAVGMYVLIGS